MWMKDFLLDDTNAASDMSLTCDSAINVSKEKCCAGGGGDDSMHQNDCCERQKRTFNCDEQLLKFKAFFFLFFAGFGATFPYLGVYFKQLGLNASYVGVLAGIRPLIQFLSGPFWALVADRYKARKLILLSSILAWLVMTLLLAFPRPRNEVCHLNNATAKRTHDMVNSNKAARSIIPYPSDFQGRFGFNFAYPYKCTDSNIIEGKQMIKIRRERYAMKKQTNNISKKSVHRRKRYAANSSEMVLSLGYEDKNNNNNNINKHTSGGWETNDHEEAYWKRGNTIQHDSPASKNVKSNDNYTLERDESEIQNLFYIFLALIVVGEFLEAPSFIMIDTALLDHLGNQKKFYGKTRLFGSIGYGVASFSVGAILDKFQYKYCGKTLTNYTLIFYIFSGAMLIAFIFGLFFIKFKYSDSKEASKPLDCIKIFCSIKYGSFLSICWFCGFCHGAIMNFLNWYLEDLGASKLMMGVATACRCSAIIFGFFTSYYFIEHFGHIVLICWALASYVGSYFGYAMLHNPWYAIPIEVVQGLIYAISWSSCITYLGEIAPPNTAATMQGILQGVYWGLGTGSGTISGGFLINHIGVKAAFRVGGVISSVVFVFFVALQYWISRREKTKDNK